ncbi:MAG: PAP2 superfamily protein [bacterium ADurb.Bin212]|nr:MAG: PAP2 superfamily protein [bacterium ADurb.Bin212]
MHNKNTQFKPISNKTYVNVLFLLVAVVANFVGSWIIKTFFPDRVAVTDLMFKITPHYPSLQYLTDIFNIFSFLLIIYYMVINKFKNANYILANYAWVYLLRAFLIIMTPLGGINGNDAQYGISAIKQYGAFPSGHTIMVTITYLILRDSASTKYLKGLALLCVIGEIITLILSRGHYSIDIVGALLLCYFVYNEIKRRKIMV